MFQLYWADDDCLPAGDRGFSYGDGLFETIRVCEGRAPLLGYHLDRLLTDSGRLGISLSRPELEKACSDAVDRYGVVYGGAPWVLKFVVTRGTGGRGYRPLAEMRPNLFVFHSPAPPGPPETGVRADFSRIPLTVNPLFSGMKTLNRLEQVMAAREMHGSVWELLMTNADGHVVEGTRTNLFLLGPEGWVTPPGASLAVSGVMRRQVIERLHLTGERLVERSVGVGELLSPHCRGVWLSNSVIGVVPVNNLAGHDLPVDNRLATICDPENRPD